MLSKLKREKIGLQNDKENMGSKENFATVIVHKNIFVKKRELDNKCRRECSLKEVGFVSQK